MSDTPLTADRIRSRLEAGALDDLVGIAIDHVLDRPIEELVDPGFVADQVRLTLEAATADDSTRRWMQQQLRTLQGKVPAGTPRDHLPPEVIEPLQQVVARPMVFDRALVGQLLDHDAARHLVTDILTNGLRGFADKLKPVAGMVSGAAQKSRGFGRLRRLSSNVQHLGDNLLGGMSRELEHRAEQKIRSFVDEALHAAMDQVADHVCDPANAGRYGGYRSHLLGVVLDTDNATLAGEVDKLDPDHLVEVAVATARTVSRREGLREEIMDVVHQALQDSGGSTLRSWLQDAGLGELSEDEWRASMQQRLAAEARVFIATPLFDEWLGDLLA